MKCHVHTATVSSMRFVVCHINYAWNRMGFIFLSFFRPFLNELSLYHKKDDTTTGNDSSMLLIHIPIYIYTDAILT